MAGTLRISQFLFFANLFKPLTVDNLVRYNLPYKPHTQTYGEKGRVIKHKTVYI